MTRFPTNSMPATNKGLRQLDAERLTTISIKQKGDKPHAKNYPIFMV